MEPNGWVSQGKGREKRRKRKEKEEKGPEVVEKRLLEASAELKSSDFWDSSKRTVLKPIRERLTPLPSFENLRLARPEPGTEGKAEDGALRCVCYGLGNFASCAAARFQLAFLISVLEELQEGKRRVRGPTVFYMVHCGKALYNNLLWRNWDPEALDKMAVVGNSFRGVAERTPRRIFEKEYGYIAKVSAAADEVAFPPDPRYGDVFGDTAVHFFPLPKVRDLPAEIWAAPEEPVYDAEDVEIVRRTP